MPLLLLALAAPTAWAACEKDTDCKGDRVCEAGVCTDPAAPPRPAPSGSTTRAQSKAPARRSAEPEISWVSRGLVDMDGAVVPIADARATLMRNHTATRELQKADSKRTIGRVSFWSGMVLVTAGVIVSFTQDCYSYYIGDYYNYYCNSNAVYGVPIALVGAGVGLGVGIPMAAAANRSERRAVEAYTDGLTLRYQDGAATVALTGGW